MNPRAIMPSVRSVYMATHDLLEPLQIELQDWFGPCDGWSLRVNLDGQNMPLFHMSDFDLKRLAEWIQNARALRGLK